MLNRAQRNELNAEKITKELSNRYLSSKIGCHESAISHYFRHRGNLSDRKEQMLIQLIKTAQAYQTITVRVPVIE